MLTSEKSSKVREDLLDKIHAMANTMDDNDRATFDEIVARARSGKKERASYTLSPALCAAIFLQANGHNREWHPADGPKNALEYARRMRSKLWDFWNGQSDGISFYTSGDLGDGQHRLSAAALAGVTFPASITFGVDFKAHSTIDDGRARQAFDHAGMSGVANAQRKQRIMRTAAGYFGKVSPEPIAFPPVKSAAELAAAIKANDQLLSQALEMGEQSLGGLAAGIALLNKGEAALAAFVLLYAGWPSDRVIRHLRNVQKGDFESDKAPLACFRELVDAKKRGRTVQATKQLAMFVMAVAKTEQGISASSTRVLKASTDKIPDPTYHHPMQAAA
jgi:hypothetical protein